MQLLCQISWRFPNEGHPGAQIRKRRLDFPTVPPEERPILGTHKGHQGVWHYSEGLHGICDPHEARLRPVQGYRYYSDQKVLSTHTILSSGKNYLLRVRINTNKISNYNFTYNLKYKFKTVNINSRGKAYIHLRTMKCSGHVVLEKNRH